MKKSIAIILVMGLFSLFSCAKKVYIDAETLEVIKNVYNEGDVLIFQNIATQETDTSTITKKEVYHNDYDWFRHDGYQPHQAKVWYQNKRLKYGENNQDRIISSEKRKPHDKDGFNVSYLYSAFQFYDLEEIDLRVSRIEEYDLETLHTITLESVPKTFSKVIIQSIGKHPRHKPEDDFKPKTLYWDKDYGIIKYITYSGEVWERINW